MKHFADELGKVRVNVAHRDVGLMHSDPVPAMEVVKSALGTHLVGCHPVPMPAVCKHKMSSNQVSPQCRLDDCWWLSVIADKQDKHFLFECRHVM